MIDAEHIRKLAKLAKIRLSAEEVAEYAPQLAAVLGHVHSLEQAELSAVPERVSVPDGATPRREDTPGSGPGSDATSDLVSLSPGHMNGYFEVPQVVPQ
jgi:aspartyl-tRNA(Asn)/glutamyl-tRNA(Gln) amidotransferase subunit C